MPSFRWGLIAVGLLCVLTPPAWAQYYVSNTPLGKKGQYTQKKDRTYVVVGCLPQKVPLPSGPLGSTYVECNDLNYVKSKVVETDFVGCKDLVRNGVVSEITMKEYKARKWSHFSFGCRSMNGEGELTGPTRKSKTLFNYSKPGDTHTLKVPSEYLPIGFTEFYHKLQLKESLMGVTMNVDSVEAISSDGVSGKSPEGYKSTGVSPSVPNPPIGRKIWNCPGGKVLTGLAVGHIPNTQGKYTRPVYFLGECRSVHAVTAHPAQKRSGRTQGRPRSR